ncbi:MAG: HAMP domain-containing histidine kinase [Solirubrobacteraceae bacterium]|nr:HAMP domain-containing histidine kinase [Solirubrobacteraceae bacterium]
MRVALRTRLVAIFAAVFAVSTAAVLLVSYVLIADQVRGTIPRSLADPILSQLAWKYVLALIGTVLIASGLGWVAAKRLLAPLSDITAAARRASEDRLNERLALDGPEDELRELADTFDAMLDRFQESIEAQRRFIANASHELRSPLTAIRTEADVTLADPDATIADLRRMGERVLEGADELDELLAALMLLARSQRGLLTKAQLDLADVAGLAVGDLRRAAEVAGVAIEVDATATPVAGDPALLRRLVANLVDNAVRYNRAGGTIWVSVNPGPRGDEAVVRVSNTGLRVPTDDVERLLQPFERLGRHGSGSGLGLSIVQAVAEAHAGSVELATREGGGLDVTVTLPAGKRTGNSVGKDDTAAPLADPGAAHPVRSRVSS